MTEQYKLEVVAPDDLTYFNSPDWESWEDVLDRTAAFLRLSRLDGRFNLVEKITKIDGDGLAKETIRVVKERFSVDIV
jgi:hypothetical protein